MNFDFQPGAKVNLQSGSVIMGCYSLINSYCRHSDEMSRCLLLAIRFLFPIGECVV